MASAEKIETLGAAEAVKHPIVESVASCIDSTASLAKEYQPEIKKFKFKIGRNVNGHRRGLTPRQGLFRGSIERSLASSAESVGFARDNSGYFLIIYGHDPDSGKPIAIADRLEPLEKWHPEGLQMIQGFVDQIYLEAQALQNGHNSR